MNTFTNKVLLDADSMVYIQAWDVKDLDNTPENYPTVISKIDQFVKNIMNATRAERYLAFLKGSQPTFRHIANPAYKANRKNGTNEWLNKWDAVIKHRLVSYWGFINVEGMEAEDAVSILARDNNFNGIIAHIDKDVDQVPGKHYDYKKLKHYTITEDEAERHLFKQVIMGDTTDNVSGIPGIGKVTAGKILMPGGGNYHQLALETYVQNYGERNGIIGFYESYLMCKLLDTPCMGFTPQDFKWVDYVPDETFIPSPEEFLESWTAPEPDTEQSFNPTNNHESSEQLI